MSEKKQKKINPPKLLRGLFTTTIAIIGTILFVAWAIIQYQVEQLVATRTSEYAHSIAQIAANSAAEALLSGDKLQLKMLVENVAKDPYIRSATIYAEDGQIVAQFPEITNPLAADETPQTIKSSTTESNNNDSENDTSNNEEETLLDNLQDTLSAVESPTISSRTRAFIQAQDDIPFIEKIVYQQVTAGWFKVSLNRQLLENSFRQSLSLSQKLIAAITGILFFVLLIVMFRYEKRVKRLVTICHRLIQVNALQQPKEKTQWMECLHELSETRFQALAEHPPQLPQQHSHWSIGQQTSNTIFCYCEFSLHYSEHEDAAASLSQAENFLLAAVQAHGLQSQGDILSGCLIPFFESKDADEGLIEIITLIHTLRECIATLESHITVRAFIAQGPLLTLENEQGTTTGIALTHRLQEKINKLAAVTKNDAIVCIAFEEEQLDALGEFTKITLADHSIMTPLYRLTSLSGPLKQQTQRQIDFILANNSPT